MNKIEKLKEIALKKEILENARRTLKEEFFGIDRCLDKIIDSIYSWYLMPEAINSPVIICLFGMTGNGKTTVIRRIVELIKFNDRFVEIQMDGHSNGGDAYSRTSICSILQGSSIQECESAILLLDEFQRFRTVSRTTSGGEVKNDKYQDIWMLLSDGQLPTSYSLYAKIEEELIADSYTMDIHDGDDEDENVKTDPWGNVIGKLDDKERLEAEEKKKKIREKLAKRRFKISLWEAKNFKGLLRLKESYETIMTWPRSKLIELCKKALDERISNTIDYSKLLIFICGNLDEVFTASDDLEDCDTDADTFHNFTNKISIIDVKNSLKERFKPEQIARFGNNFVIYPSLNKEAYKKIINKCCNNYINFAKNNLQLNFNLQQSVYDKIYQNGVFPASGTRPVFSTIHKMFSTLFPNVGLWHLENNIENNDLCIDITGDEFVIVSGDKEMKLKVELDIDIQRKKNSLDFNVLVGTHEAGHAIVYAILTGYCPIEININLASFKGGYNLFESNFSNKTDIFNSISTLLAGTCAEEVVFGKDYRSCGCAHDILKATVLTSQCIRNYGFSSFTSWFNNSARDDTTNGSILKTDDILENILNERKNVARDILIKNKLFLKKIIDVLLEQKTIKAREFIEIAANFGLSLKQNESDVNMNYHDMLKDINKPKNLITATAENGWKS